MRRGILLSLWLVTDLLLFVGVYAGAYFVRVGFIFSTDFPFDRFLIAASLAAPVWLAMLIGTRTFALLRKQLSLRTLAYVVYACVGGAALFSLLYYFLFGAFFSRGLLLLALALSIVCTWAWHLAFGFLARTFMRTTPATYPTLIVGLTREAQTLVRSMREHRSPLTVVGILATNAGRDAAVDGVPVLGRLHKLEDVLKTHGITHLIQASDLEHSLNLLSACRARGITYMVLPSVLGIVERDERIEILEGRPMTTVRPNAPLWRWFFQ